MRSRRHHPVLISFAAVLVVAAVALFAFAEANIPKDAQEQEIASIKAAVMQSAVQCFATEGAYPSTLAHLENEYKLVVNHEDYIVSYTCFAPNIAPDVEVISVERD